MCGICGEIDYRTSNVGPGVMKRMCNVLAYRGPDDEGMVFFKGNRFYEMKRFKECCVAENAFEAGLGHRRLSIIDLSDAGHQPMCNENGGIWIVFNGEIYNFQELRLDLEKKGHFFKSRSDTETILHGYEEWGVECLQRLRGMFAFAIWDNKQKRLFMARDRLGKKPLVYVSQRGRFAFASEIKALLEIPWVERRVNHHALHAYLTYQYVPSPETIFEGIQKLPPAHYLLYDREGNLKIQRYWKLDFSSDHRTDRDLPELCDRIRTGLEESVKLRLISDVPLGAFLSGGVDSSLIVGIMAKLSGSPVKTFSIGFNEKEFDELFYARIVSKRFGTEHHEFVVKPDAIEILPKLVWQYNEPFADSSAIPTYYVAKMTKDFVKVVLTGDAGDENFAGYPRYLRSKWVALFTELPEKIRKDILPSLLRLFSSFRLKKSKLNRLADFMQMLTDDQARNYFEQIKVFNAKEKENIYTKEFNEDLKKEESSKFLLDRFKELETKDFLDELLYLDINTYLPEDLLVKMDIATMANSLEARVPFLDHQFMEFTARIPSQLKLRGFVSKFILKKAFSDLLPVEIRKRRKMGFGVPVSRWIRNELKNDVFEILLDRRTSNRGFFRRESVEQLLDEHLALQYDHSAKIWALLVLETWFRIFIDQEGNFFSCGV